MTAMRKLLVALGAAMLLGGHAAGAVQLPSNVTIEQVRYSRNVRITYDLAQDAIVTLAIEVDGAALADNLVTSLSGDVCRRVVAGSGRSIIWRAGVDWPGHDVTGVRAVVTAWPVDDPPEVLMVDLSGGLDAPNYPVTYYPSLKALPHGGITNDFYKSAAVVLRRITLSREPPYGLFRMGAEDSSAVAVQLTRDYYIGIYQITQGQWYNVLSGPNATFRDEQSRYYRAMNQPSYEAIRGGSLGAGWPLHSEVDSNSFIGILRARTDLEGLVIDLPTEAQWEYACRANTQSYYHDNLWGIPENTASNAQMDVLGRYKFNGGYVWDENAAEGGNGGEDDEDQKEDHWISPDVATCGPEQGIAIVGSYLPNAWGLYDMHGNVNEYCLDWYGALQGGADPVGAATDSYRVVRGGSWNYDAATSRSGYRGKRKPDEGSNRLGLRLVATVPLAAGVAE